MRLLLFDVDGTLVRVNGAGREALREAMRRVYGRTGPIDGYDFHGRTDPAIVRGLLRATGLDDASIDRELPRLWPLYREALERELAARREALRACPGVPELLVALEDRPDLVCGLLTGNVADGAWRKLAACGLDGHFAFGAFGSDSELREELPAVALERARHASGRRWITHEALVIGDTPEDIRCARAVGARCLAVATGRYSADELAERGPDAVLPDLTDLEAVLAVAGTRDDPGAG